MLGQNYIFSLLIGMVMFVIIFTYPVLVMFDLLLPLYVLYASILIFSIFLFTKHRIDYSRVELFEKLMLVLFGLILINLIREFSVLNDFYTMFRTGFIYLFPFIFSYLVFNNKYKVKNLVILNIFLFASFLICIELLYEFFYDGVTYFEYKNFEYIKEKSGLELNQMLGGLRNNGLMDHIHVTSTFIGFGAIIAVMLYIKTKQDGSHLYIIYLLLSIILFIGLLCIGVRLTFLSFLVWFIIIFIIEKNYRHELSTWLFIAIAVTIVLVHVTFNYKLYFWSAVYLQYVPDFILNIYGIKSLVYANSAGNCSLEAIKNVDYNQINSELIDFLIGLGFGNIVYIKQLANDDLFFLQLFFHLGLFGSIIFLLFLKLAFKDIKSLIVHKKYTFYGWIFFGFLVILIVSMLHSGVLIRKQIFFIFIFILFLINFISKQPTKGDL